MISEKGIEVLKLRRAASQAAASKFNALLTRQTDGRVTGSFLFAGASRTQRWSGRGLQLQNLKRPPKGQDNDKVAKSLLDGSFDHRYGGPGALEVLGGSIRAAIAARDGYSLVVRDLASIESRVLGWLSGDPATMAIFRTGRDSYKDFASRWFKVPYEEVTKEQRFLSKPPTLGCGYGLGAQGLVGYAAKMGIVFELEQAQEAVGVFRSTYFKIPLLWRTVEAAFTAAVLGQDSDLAFLRFAREGDMVTVRLPSGRKLYYHKPEVDDDGITYMGMDQYTHKWARLRTWGGKIVENCVAGDSLVLTDTGWKPLRDIEASDKVHDGVDFVTHGGLLCKSVQLCTSIDGVYMTPEHEVLTNDGWKPALEEPRPYRPKIRGAGRPFSRKVRWKKALLELSMRLRAKGSEGRHGSEERGEAWGDSELRVSDTFPPVETENPRHEPSPGLLGVEVNARPMPSSVASGVEELRREGHNRLQRVGGILRSFLVGHGGELFPRSNPRKTEQRPRLLEAQLPLDTACGAGEEQKEQSTVRHTTSPRVNRRLSVDTVLPLKPRAVYDILDCGPRQRFVVFGEKGPFVVHNCVQAIARDVLAHGMLLVDGYNLPIVLHVHDEIGCEVMNLLADAALDIMGECMDKVPEWAPGLLLASAGYTAKRYRKD